MIIMRTAVKMMLLSAGPCLVTGCGDISIAAPGNEAPGAIQILTSTTGADVDPDGYQVTLDEELTQSVGINASVSFLNLVQGTYSVLLSNVASNCGVTGENPRSIFVFPGNTTINQFDVVCAAAAPELDLVADRPRPKTVLESMVFGSVPSDAR